MSHMPSAAEGSRGTDSSRIALELSECRDPCRDRGADGLKTEGRYGLGQVDRRSQRNGPTHTETAIPQRVRVANEGRGV